MLINLSFLKTHRDYRYLFLGQTISAVGSMMTYIALPYQMYELTKSSFSVGMISIAELCPLLITAFLGGAYADRLDRRKLLLRSEFARGPQPPCSPGTPGIRRQANGYCT